MMHGLVLLNAEYPRQMFWRMDSAFHLAWVHTSYDRSLDFVRHCWHSRQVLMLLKSNANSSQFCMFGFLKIS